MDSITRISDLPDQSNVYSPSLPTPPVQQINTGNPSGYVPINIHPNPYGVSAQNPIMPHPQQPEAPNSQIPYFSEEQLLQMQRQRLPSRDIPRNTTEHSQDEEVRANYIPKVKFEEDYVRRHEDLTERNLKEYENKNRREKKIDILFNELQTPIFLTILFFFFQLPLVNLFFKRFAFLSIYNSDGHFNFNGLLFKSILFGSAYYSIMKMTTLLSEF